MYKEKASNREKWKTIRAVAVQRCVTYWSGCVYVAVVIQGTQWYINTCYYHKNEGTCKISADKSPSNIELRAFASLFMSR